MVAIKDRIEAIAKYNPNYNSRGMKVAGQWWNAHGTEAAGLPQRNIIVITSGNDTQGEPYGR